MSESSVIRSIIKEMIISEADTTRDMGLSLSINAGEFFPPAPISSARGQAGIVSTYGAESSAATLVIAKIRLTRADLESLALENENSPKKSINFMQELRKFTYYRQITKGAGGGIELLTTGEIEEVARRAAGPDTALGTENLVYMTINLIINHTKHCCWQTYDKVQAGPFCVLRPAHRRPIEWTATGTMWSPW
jgi:hypothetical protein